MSDNQFISSLNLPSNLGVSTTTLTSSQRQAISQRVVANSEETLDFDYNHRDRVVMVGILNEAISSGRIGMYLGIAASVASNLVMNSAGFLPGKGKIVRVPFVLLSGGVTYWLWTESRFRHYQYNAFKVNQRISTTLNKMTDLE